MSNDVDDLRDVLLAQIRQAAERVYLRHAAPTKPIPPRYLDQEAIAFTAAILAAISHDLVEKALAAAKEAAAPMEGSTIPKVGTLLWIRKEDYPAMLEIFDDGEEWPPTYEEWLKASEETEQDARAAGGLTRRVYINPQTFPAMCRQYGVPPDANGRMKIMLSITAQDPTPE